MSERKTFTSSLIVLDSNVWGIGFLVPKDVSDYFIQFDKKRYIFYIDGNGPIHRTMMPLGDGQYFIHVSKPLMKEMGVVKDQRCEISVELDNSRYGMNVSEEFQEALDIFHEANAHFHKLTPGKQRNLIHMVNTMKRPESRAKKAVHIMEYLETYHGKLDFKALHAWFKMQNSR